MTLCKSVEFYEYVQVGPGRNTSRVTADSVIMLELCESPEGVVIDGRLFIPMSNVKAVELADGAMLGKASTMLVKPEKAEEPSSEQRTRRDGGRKAR